MISKDDIDKIFEAARIEEVVGDFVSLKKRGANLLGLCPFHNEKTPSFTVSPAKGIYKCFGCGKAGNAVNFIMEHEHHTYPEALRYLAKKYQIEIQETEATPEMLAQESERESLLVVSNFAAQFFRQQMHETDEGKMAGLSYFQERGFRDDIIQKFQLGYSPDNRDALFRAAQEAGHQAIFLEKAGLCIPKEHGYIDRFRARVMFPVHNQTGRIIAFGGRALKKDEKAKYINSPESEIYHKSNVLYGLYFAKKAIIQQDLCYLVEGYTDVISLFQAGVENVVASSGTSLTVEQIRLIKRYTNNITILYDGDAAGIKASFRGIDMILEEGMNVRVVRFPNGEDPDSFARSHTSEELSNYVTQSARDFIQFKTGVLKEDVGNDPIRKTELIKEIVSSISFIPDPIQRAVYIRECAGLLQTEEQALLNSLNYLRRQNLNKKLNRQQPDERQVELEQPVSVTTDTTYADVYDEAFEVEKEIIRLLLNFGTHEMVLPNESDSEEQEQESATHIRTTLAEYILNDMQEDAIRLVHPLFSIIYNEYQEMHEQHTVPNQQHFIKHANPEICNLSINMISQPHRISERWEKMHHIVVPTEEEMLQKAANHALFSLKLYHINRQMQEIEESLKTIVSEEEQLQALKQYAECKDTQIQLARLLGDRIILK